MEEKNLTPKEQKIILENRKKLVVSGIDKIETVNLNQISMQTNTSLLCVFGSNLHIEKLDVLVGHVEICGQIDSLKFVDKKQNFFKRIFK